MLLGMEHTPSRLATVSTLALLVALQACGGGGDGAAAPTPAPSPSPTPAAPVAPSPPAVPPTTGTRATCNLANFQAEALALVNAQRTAGASCGTQGSFAATTALAWKDPLTQASLVHSDDMVSGNFFSHTGSTGLNAGQRATAAGYVWALYGDKIIRAL